MNLLHHLLRLVASLVLLVSLLWGTSPARAAAAWHVVPGAVVVGPDYLAGVAALSASDVWAVGDYAMTGTGTLQTLTEHYNGTAWNAVASPNANGDNNVLTGVSALSATNIWAVGHDFVANTDSQTLVEHYNGSTWSVVTSPNVGTIPTYLNGVSATSASDVWAVGYSGQGTSKTLIEHYNGTSWSVISSPNVGSSTNQLTAVSALSSANVWAVGYDYNSTSHATQTLILHYNGSSWSVVSSPNPGSNTNHLNGVSALSASDVWAVGHQAASSTSSQQTLALHYNGTSWSVVTSPNVGSGNNFLSAVHVTSTSDVWAVGDASSTSSSSKQTLIEHYNGSSWSVVSSPNVGSGDNALKGVSVLSATDVWAVGYDTPSSGATQTLTEHNAGTSWGVVASPNIGVGPADGALNAVSALSASDIWAVGTYRYSGNTDPLIEHYNGSSWSVVASPAVAIPNLGTNYNTLTGVSAASATDVWAVGNYNTITGSSTLILHYNGTSWSVVSSPSPGSNYNFLSGVKAISASDVWAVGGYCTDPTGQCGSSTTLILHYNGTSWSVVSSPNVGSSSGLDGVTATSTSDVWAVGGQYIRSTGINATLIEHYNGSTWSVVTSPNGGANNGLTGVSATSATNVWAVGDYRNSSSTQQTLTEHYNGTAWSVVTSPNVGSGDNTLTGVSATSAADVWTTGYYNNSSTQQTLIEHYNGTAWSVVASPNVGSGFNDLSGVSALSASDVWTVGTYQTGSLSSNALIEHYS